MFHPFRTEEDGEGPKNMGSGPNYLGAAGQQTNPPLSKEHLAVATEVSYGFLLRRRKYSATASS